MNDTDRQARARMMKARELATTDDARKLYADWAKDYDADIYDKLGVTGSQRVAALLSIYNTQEPQQLPVLDAGCGTGAVAVYLQGRGFATIDGIDLSPEMLDVARSRKLYRHLHVGDLNQPLPLEVGPYRAIVSAGTFTSGHVGAAGFSNLFSHLAGGGILACAIADTIWQRDTFEALLAGMNVTKLFHDLESVVPDMPADTHMLVIRRQELDQAPDTG